MVDKDQELLKFVKEKKIWNMILQPNFPEEAYKQVKKEYFSDLLKNKLGKVKDSDIARIALDHLLRIGYFRTKTLLNEALQRPFFSKTNINRELYLQKWEMKRHTDALDLGLIEKREFEISKLEEGAKEVIEDSSPEIDEKIKEKPTIPGSITSVLDQQQDIAEPKVIEEIKESKFDPWWKKLGLTSNPFPNTDGLGNIPKSLYEHVVLLTEIFEKYVHYINNIPSELFMNTIIFGEFGSGKTTLFQYLQIPLVRNNIHSMIIRLNAEPDYQNFLIKFKQKLCRELTDIFYKLTGTDIAASLESLSFDDAITRSIRSIEETNRCAGFLIFIDDIYKPPDYERVALKFLNQLQTFKAELMKEMTSSNIGFFISAPLEWESILTKDKA